MAHRDPGIGSLDELPAWRVARFRQVAQREFTGVAHIQHVGRARCVREQRPELTAVAYPIPDSRIGPILEAVHRFDKAHLVMLGEAGLIGREELAQLLRVLQEFDKDPEGVTAARLRGGGGNHSGEKYLIARVGEKIAGRIHAGRHPGPSPGSAAHAAHVPRRRLPLSPPCVS